MAANAIFLDTPFFLAVAYVDVWRVRYVCVVCIIPEPGAPLAPLELYICSGIEFCLSSKYRETPGGLRECICENTAPGTGAPELLRTINL